MRLTGLGALRRILSVVLLVLLAVTVAGCRPERSVREWLVEANRLVMSGDSDEAREIYEQLYAEHPEHVHVLLDLAAFYVEQEELVRAEPLLARLREMELGANDGRRRETVERRYLETVYAQSRGDGPAAPADEEAYVEALRGLIQISRGRTGTELDEYVTYLVIRARRAIGGADNVRMEADDPRGLVQQASATQAREAMHYIRRLFGRDDGLSVRPVLDPDIRRELEAAAVVLEKTVFFDDFDRSWRDQERTWAREGRYDADLAHFIVHYEGALMDDLSAETPIETLTGRALSWYAREIATDLVYELRGAPRGEGEPLGYRLDDFAEATAAEVRVTATGQMAFTAGIPWATVRKGAWLLEERTQAAEAAAEDRQQ